MPIITGRENVLAVYEEAARRTGCICVFQQSKEPSEAVPAAQHHV